MRDSMDMLQSLNMKEAELMELWDLNLGVKGDAPDSNEEKDDIITRSAFNEKTSLLRVVLPDTLKGIGECAFRSCVNLTSAQ